MAQLNQNFDANQVDPTNHFDPVPAGEYPVMIVDSEMKPTKSGSGEYLQMELEIIDGPYKGRKAWDRLNLNNPNQTAVEIAQRTLSQICHAVGVLNVTDSVELHNKPMIARLSYRPAEGQFDAGNEVKGYKAMSGQPAQQQAAPTQQQAAQPTAAPTAQKPAWAK